MTNSASSLHDTVVVARPIVERVVWCTVTTVSGAGEPRSRLMHPVWWWDGPEPMALVTARPTPLKVRHLRTNPLVSCSYWDPAHDTVVVDATASWVAADDRQAAWDAVAAVAPPVGFDPALVWPSGPGSADCGFLRLVAQRIVATPAGQHGRLWSVDRG